MGIAPLKVHAVLNGCDFGIFQPMDKGTARATLGVDANAELIVYAGSLIPTKGLRELKRAFLHLKVRRPRLQLAMLGVAGCARSSKAPVSSLQGYAITGRWLRG